MSGVQINITHRYNTNSLKTKRLICEQTHNINVNDINDKVYKLTNMTITLTTSKPLIESSPNQS